MAQWHNYLLDHCSATCYTPHAKASFLHNREAFHTNQVACATSWYAIATEVQEAALPTGVQGALTGRFFVKLLGKPFGRVGAGEEWMRSGGPCGRPRVEIDVFLV